MLRRLCAVVLVLSGVGAGVAGGVSATAELPRCARGAYSYDLGLNGAQGALVLDAHVKDADRRDCRVLDRVVLRLTDVHGHLLPVRSNPIHALIAAVDMSGEVEQTYAALVAWRNWCASRPRAFAFTVRSSVKFARYSWHQFPLPACIDPSSPSYLRLFTDRG